MFPCAIVFELVLHVALFDLLFTPGLLALFFENLVLLKLLLVGCWIVAVPAVAFRVVIEPVDLYDHVIRLDVLLGELSSGLSGTFTAILLLVRR